MRENKRHLIVIALFALWIQFLAIEHARVKAYGYWGVGEIGSVVIATQGATEFRVVKGSAARRAQWGGYSYVSELWACAMAAANTGLPYFIYWYYFWYL